MRFALNSLAVVAGDWLLQHSEQEWVDRYGHRTRVRSSSTKPGRSPSLGRSHRRRWLNLVDRYLRSRRSCEARVRSRQSRFCAASGSKITAGWMVTSVGEAMTISLQRPSSSIPPTSKKHAPAKSARQGGPVTSVHLTETCDQDRPHLITHVATTPAPTTDEKMTEPIHADLETSRTHPTPTLARLGIYHRTDPGLESATVWHRSDWTQAPGWEMAGQQR